MNYPVPRGTSGEPLPLANIDQFPRRWMNDTSRALEPVYRGTIVDTARAQAAGHVLRARINTVQASGIAAIHATNELIHEAQAMAAADPLQADLYNGFVNDCTHLMRYALRRLPEEW